MIHTDAMNVRFIALMFLREGAALQLANCVGPVATSESTTRLDDETHSQDARNSDDVKIVYSY